MVEENVQRRKVAEGVSMRIKRKDVFAVYFILAIASIVTFFLHEPFEWKIIAACLTGCMIGGVLTEVSRYEQAKCNSCGHIQDAKKGFPCEKCKGETFTEQEEKDLVEASNSKTPFVPLE